MVTPAQLQEHARDTAWRSREAAKVALTRFPRAYDAARRPWAIARFALRRPHEPDFAAFGLFPDRDGMLLDVGANAGMSALSFRLYRPDNPILSVEPNPFHRPDLAFVGRVVGRFSYLMAAAGAEPGEMRLYVPVLRRIPITTAASLLPEEAAASPTLRDRLGERMDGPDFSVAEVDVPVVVLDDLELSPDFVKLDVQGYESEVLDGLERTIERSRPVLLVESPEPEVRAWLAERGYLGYRYDRDTHRLAADGRRADNLVFVPAEDVPAIRRHLA
jgi:FkbM family methyltransferase